MSKQDKSFDNKVHTFKNNIYGSSKGKVREAILMRDLGTYLEGKGQLSILDVGGGQGQVALQLAQLGHKVTISDISNEMLDKAREAAQVLGLSNVTFLHKPLQELESEQLGQFDLVLCHAVFEWLESPFEAFGNLKSLCIEAGTISLMFYNQVGQTLSNLVYGNFDYIRNGMQAKKVVKLNPQKALHPDTVLSWAKALNLTPITKSGVRCFHDYMRDIKMWQLELDGIIEMELEYSQLEPYASIGRYMHLLLKKD